MNMFTQMKQQSLEDKGLFAKKTYDFGGKDNINFEVGEGDFNKGSAPAVNAGGQGNGGADVTIGLNGTLGIGG